MFPWYTFRFLAVYACCHAPTYIIHLLLMYHTYPINWVGLLSSFGRETVAARELRAREKHKLFTLFKYTHTSPYCLCIVYLITIYTLIVCLTGSATARRSASGFLRPRFVERTSGDQNDRMTSALSNFLSNFEPLEVHIMCDCMCVCVCFGEFSSFLRLVEIYIL